MNAASELARSVGTSKACLALEVPRASFYRWKKPVMSNQEPSPRSRPVRALTSDERHDVLDVLHSERFVDKPPAEVYATLLDEGNYLCSIRTMYRILTDSQEVRDRRNQLRHPAYKKPELLATAPNQVWSWDITKLLGLAKWTYFYLYVILDIYSRYAVGWTVQHRESAELAKALIAQAVGQQAIEPSAPIEPAAPLVVPEPGLAIPDLPFVGAAKPSEAADAAAEAPNPPPESRRRGWWQRLTK